MNERITPMSNAIVENLFLFKLPAVSVNLNYTQIDNNNSN